MTWDQLLPMLWEGTVETLYMTLWSSAIAYTMKGVIGTKGAAFLRGDDIWDNTELIIQTFGKKE